MFLTRRIAALLLGANLVLGATAFAQDKVAGKYYPLDHRQPVGMAGRWSALTKPDFQGYFQPVKISLPSTGEVAFYMGSPNNVAPYGAPAKVGFAPGYSYRVKISGMPEFPGVELYPTIELIDRLHAPENLRDQFPVPIEITAEEVELALQDRMITKVVYLEQPDRAPPIAAENVLRTEDLAAKANLLEAADIRGRPIAIVRIGGRIPDANASTDEFHSTAPVQLHAATATNQ